MMLIDFENHFYDKSTIGAMETREGFPCYDPQAELIHWTKNISMPQKVILPKLLEIGADRIAMMDKLNIAMAVISTAQGVEDLDPGEAVELCRKTNDAVYRLTQEFPGRYLGSAILPVKDVQAAEDELVRCVQELGFVAWHTHSNYGNESAEAKKFLRLFKKAAQLNVYVYLHPGLPQSDAFAGYGFTFAGPGVGFTVDTMTTALKLISEGVFDEVPETKLLMGHLGEGIPFLLDRIDNRFHFIPNPNLKNQQKPSYYFKHNIMVTTSGNMSPEAFRCTRDVLGIDNILFGSDYPFEAAEDMVTFVEGLPLSVADRAKLYYKNAERLGIYLPGTCTATASAT